MLAASACAFAALSDETRNCIGFDAVNTLNIDGNLNVTSLSE